MGGGEWNMVLLWAYLEVFPAWLLYQRLWGRIFFFVLFFMKLLKSFVAAFVITVRCPPSLSHCRRLAPSQSYLRVAGAALRLRQQSVHRYAAQTKVTTASPPPKRFLPVDKGAVCWWAERGLGGVGGKRQFCVCVFMAAPLYGSERTRKVK